MQDRIKKHYRDIRLAHTQTSAISERANETGYLPLWNQVKLSIVTLTNTHAGSKRVSKSVYPININRDSGIEIPEAWITMIRKHNSRSTTKRTTEGTSSVRRKNNED